MSNNPATPTRRQALPLVGCVLPFAGRQAGASWLDCVLSFAGRQAGASLVGCVLPFLLIANFVYLPLPLARPPAAHAAAAAGLIGGARGCCFDNATSQRHANSRHGIELSDAVWAAWDQVEGDAPSCFYPGDGMFVVADPTAPALQRG